MDTEPVTNREVPTWWKEQFHDRLDRCRVMLYVHGLLTDHENGLVRQRHRKMIVEEIEKSEEE